MMQFKEHVFRLHSTSARLEHIDRGANEMSRVNLLRLSGVTPQYSNNQSCLLPFYPNFTKR